MHLVNRFDRRLKVLTYNVSDTLMWVPHKQYEAPPNSLIHVDAHDGGRCRVRVFWSEHGGLDLGVHAEHEVLLLVPPPPRAVHESLEDPTIGGPDELTGWLRERQEMVRLHHLSLPWHTPDQPPQGMS